MRTLYVVATYDIEQTYAGPEEGGRFTWDGPLVEIEGAFFDNDSATERCWDLNQDHISDGDIGRYRRLSSTVVEIPRRIPSPETPSCHVDPDQVEEVTRFDVPRYYRDDEPASHYC